MILLHNTVPPFQEVAKLGSRAAWIYGMLWQSAAMDCEMDLRKDLSWDHRRDCGGIAEWSKKGLAEYLGASRNTISQAIDDLLDAGFITVAGIHRTPNGKPYCVYRVIHPKMIDAQRYALSMFDQPPSVRYKHKNKSEGDTAERWSGDNQDNLLD